MKHISYNKEGKGECLMTEEVEYLTATQARDLLGVSQGKMTALIREGQLPTYPDPLNKRVKLIKKSDVDALLAQTVRQRKPVHAKRRNKKQGEQREQITQVAA